MTIEKGARYGQPGRLPGDGVVVGSDREARHVLEQARHDRRPFPPLGLVGGDLCRTLGGGSDGSEERLRSDDAMTFAVDLGEVLLDGRLHLFVAHCLARNRLWTRAVVAMNGQWIGRWNAGPRAHPGDGLLDTYDVRLPFGQLLAVRSRIFHGAHLPHPCIRERRGPAVQFELDRALPVWLDGERLPAARTISVRVEPDALTVIV